MSYKLPTDLDSVYQRYHKDSEALHDISSDIALMRSLIEQTVAANEDNPERSLKAVEGSLAVLIKLERRLMELDVLKSQLLDKSAVSRLAEQIISILSGALENHDQRNEIVDSVAPQIANAIVDAKNAKSE